MPERSLPWPGRAPGLPARAPTGQLHHLAVSGAGRVPQHQHPFIQLPLLGRGHQLFIDGQLRLQGFWACSSRSSWARFLCASSSITWRRPARRASLALARIEASTLVEGSQLVPRSLALNWTRAICREPMAATVLNKSKSRVKATMSRVRMDRRRRNMVGAPEMWLVILINMIYLIIYQACAHLE